MPSAPWKARDTLSYMAKRTSFARNLEVYAFWTGFLSTIISLVQVVVIALKS